MKKVIGIIISSIAFLVFISLYFIVIFNQNDYVKYLVTILGYESIILFTVGILMFKKEREKDKEKTDHKFK